MVSEKRQVDIFGGMAGVIPINKQQKEVEKAKLTAEAKELKHLKAIYTKAAEDVTNKISISNGKINVLLKDYDNLDEVQKSILQSQIYQKKFQESLQKQLDGFLADLNSGQYKSIDEYLNGCYETGFLGSMYDIHGQGIPIITPIDQKQVIKAKDIDSKISKKLYTKLGEDVDLLKKRIANNISRGIATSDSFANIARNISSASNMGFNKAMRIARTEGHRIQATAAFDAQKKAKDAGADIVKQWDAALDGRTRDTHRKLDGQIRELDEPFEVNGHKAMHPAGFGRPEEDINCRCALLQRAKWALDEDELQTLQDRAAFFELDKTKDFEDFCKKYKVASDSLKKFDITEGGKYTQLKISDKNKYADYIEHEFTTQKMTVKELNQMWDKSVGYIQNSQGYQDINGFMRGLKSKLDNSARKVTIRVMERLTNNNSLKKDYIGMRKVDSSYLVNVLGIDVSGLFKISLQKNAFGRPTRTNVPKDKAAAQILADKINALVGTDKGSVTDKAFTSVSMSEKLNYFTHYPIKFEIQMPAGTKGVLTNNLPESEFIAKSGSTIEIMKAEVYNDGTKDCVRILSRLVQQ